MKNLARCGWLRISIDEKYKRRRLNVVNSYHHELIQQLIPRRILNEGSLTLIFIAWYLEKDVYNKRRR